MHNNNYLSDKCLINIIIAECTIISKMQSDLLKLHFLLFVLYKLAKKFQQHQSQLSSNLKKFAISKNLTMKVFVVLAVAFFALASATRGKPGK